MSNLDKFMKDHHDEFDSYEPESGHFKRFENRFTRQPQLKIIDKNHTRLLRIAAIIIVLICVSVFVFDFASREIREQYISANQNSEIPAEIREAVHYYDNQAITQIATINKLAANQKDAGILNITALKEIQSLDATTDDLKKSLSGNPGNEHILDAIIRSQQMKEKILNTMIAQLNHIQK